MSLLLVLAMVLAMVPAVLAAETNPTKSLTAAPGETLPVELPETFAGTKYYWKVGSSSGYLTVPYYTSGETAKKNSITVASGITKAVSNQYVYVYETAEAASSNRGFNGTGSNKAVYAFIISITPWSVKLELDPSSKGFSNTLEQGKSVKLLATVTGPTDKIESAEVKFETIGAAGVATLNPEKIKVIPTSATTATAQVTVTAGSLTGKIRVSASVTPAGVGSTTVTATYPSNGYIEVRSGASYTLTLAEKNIYVTKGGTTKSIQPKLMLGTKTVTGTYTYEPETASNMVNGKVQIVVNPDGSIYPQVDETTAPVKVTVTETTSGLTEDCYINVVKDAATITGLTVDTDLTNKRFAKIDVASGASPDYTALISSMVTGTLTLKATVESESSSAASRLVWTSSNEKIATVTPKSGSDTVTVTAVGTGKVTITATMPSTSGSGTSKSVEIYVWDAKAYNKIEKPTLGDTINDPYTTCTELAKQPLKATLVQGTNKTVTKLCVSNY